uniref:Uncharacterized protein n=1 Tax=Panagrolaimus sp. JU765 TaxID=591449 RepID=A0AC34Q2I1_9BILA
MLMMFTFSSSNKQDFVFLVKFGTESNSTIIVDFQQSKFCIQTSDKSEPIHQKSDPNFQLFFNKKEFYFLYDDQRIKLGDFGT